MPVSEHGYVILLNHKYVKWDTHRETYVLVPDALQATWYPTASLAMAERPWIRDQHGQEKPYQLGRAVLLRGALHDNLSSMRNPVFGRKPPGGQHDGKRNQINGQRAGTVWLAP